MNSQALRVSAVEPLTPRITRFRFEHPEGQPLPLFSGGAHVVVEMPDGDTLRRNAYSLISDPMDGSGYEIAVQREEEGRGGSRFMHTQVKPGDMLNIGTPLNLLSLDLRARKHVLIAGGIGITPFLAQIKQLIQMGLTYELHYAARSRDEAAGLALLPEGTNLHLYFDAEGEVVPIQELLARQPTGTHVYTCGPKGMIAAVKEQATALGWPASAVHSEAFTAPPPGQAFTVTLAKSGKTLTVGPHQSLLEALEAAEVDVSWSCRGGACGQCETSVSTCAGELQHNDHWLSEEDRAANTKIMPCVSRFVGQDLTLDL
ncbi:2Fe-2S iron-sulfur cluster binding domain-containing protein [Epibacterium sp. SM1979]|uniref:2Fe-2S iron-sulfur cluster binding domain-containing protein n=1 Tax=Tritonibacter litoralis TaxID=2662264 RepID=A0A843YHZ0_9RHOB|nr:PDR/VanB family oxidoreductase [Tritonibacter litoralis]MQQ08882.1 2Fe-2S iron-sulfur cluster binding domain-containing protein [Tritonibacter litoralis]